ncbi:eukaryotic peptide chain release factor GTP-binding subunit ERF3A-like [Lineus longissimus]|uniref:eukaryotic peptide chain release factor GTP-binding subunit ERF3A-like n=1 Tax=Lineus longissimus TaxID=88925 RepID=UPI002B4FA82C
MANPEGQNNLPDSWETQDDGTLGDQDSGCNTKSSFASLNVDAPAFVPGQNIHAKEFVPCWGPQSDSGAVKDAAGETETKEMKDSSPGHAMNNRGDEEPPPPDDWSAENGNDNEEKSGSSADSTSPTGTPASASVENSDPDEEDEDSAEARPVRRKKDPSVCEEKPKEHVNIVFIGHVDAGKSTIGGHIMHLTGMVDKRTLEKYEKEAKEKNRETWYLSWALDTNSEERDKGKTVEVGRAYFETETKHFTILDAPGHKSFVPNMIGGASQADLAVLVISARRGEFETGFERGGQTREHAMLAKTAGVRQLIVLINKMDDPTVLWDEARYNHCVDKLKPYLRKIGFNPKTDIYFMPVSGYTGAFLKNPPTDNCCPWYTGPSLIQYLEDLPKLTRSSDGPLRIPIVDRYKDMGTIILGKVESGSVSQGQKLLMMPNRTPVEVMQLWSDEEEKDICLCGENIKVKLKNVEEEDVSPGFVLCDPSNVCTTVKTFDAQIFVIEHKSIICAGYNAVMHIHACAEEVRLDRLLFLIDKKTGAKTKAPRYIKQDQIAVGRFHVTGGHLCMEKFTDFDQMGRFTLRDEGKTVAAGKVVKLVDYRQ